MSLESVGLELKRRNWSRRRSGFTAAHLVVGDASALKKSWLHMPNGGTKG